jgi:hypothetical protein
MTPGDCGMLVTGFRLVRGGCRDQPDARPAQRRQERRERRLDEVSPAIRAEAQGEIVVAGALHVWHRHVVVRRKQGLGLCRHRRHGASPLRACSRRS